MSNNPNKVTFADAKRVLKIVDAGLSDGLGNPIPGQMCVEAAVCFALGQPHGDRPSCVAPAVRRFKIALNDQSWSSSKARAAGLRRIAIAQLGTADVINQKQFLRTLCELTIREIVPIALRAAAKKNPKHAARIESAATRCEQEGTHDSALAAKKVASAITTAAAAAITTAYASSSSSAYAAAAYASSAYAAAAYAYASSAYAAAAYAAAAASAAEAASYAADAASRTAKSKRRDQILGVAAEIGVKALRACGAVGIKWMDKLAPLYFCWPSRFTLSHETAYIPAQSVRHHRGVVSVGARRCRGQRRRNRCRGRSAPG